ncbi:bifunctional protein HldE [bacterium BMS3Abin05]|nr:bifunctional protein HldE [bacterium BMS3Abin05]GBE26833.1 bifunctional protein HldE [bacterium BMS3Bbin03]HDZ11547.1 D-glycero-beta-D-manno-heptose 1-phosphate adenylyltransferase [Bacteroidota bacterium]
MGRIVSREEIVRLRNELRDQGKLLVFTNGIFDLLHRGHLDLLNRAKNLGDVLVVGLNSDASARRNKGQKRPIISQDDRAFMLCHLIPVDYVLIFEEDTPYECIKEIKPDVLVKGADYAVHQIVGSDIVLGYGGKVVPVPLARGKSSTQIINSIVEKFVLNLNKS